MTGIRDEVRSVIAGSGTELNSTCDAWLRGHDIEFTKLLAAHGLIGITWPVAYGGRGATAVDRLIVTEELLRVAAPVAAHWIADRQIGPAILRHGSPELQQEFLPRIAAGEVTFCLGMSESESGSDLAALRTRAIRDGDSYRISGTKIWTSHAHRSTHAYVLARTDSTGAKHEGLTEFVVDLSTPGITVRPIYDLAGEHHFNEMHFDDVVVPARNVIGTVGQGWTQVTEQLAFERGGMERVLSTYPLLAAMLSGSDDASGDIMVDAAELGVLVARLLALRAMASGVAAAMDSGEAPVHLSALLKVLGNAFENDVVDVARESSGMSPDPQARGVEGLLASGVLSLPGVTLRGGATEVLLSIIARHELSGDRRTDGDELGDIVEDVLGRQPVPEDPGELGAVWETAVALGWTGIGVAESAGGSGGDLADLAVVATQLGRHGLSAPIVETAVSARILAAAGKRVDLSRPVVTAVHETVLLHAGVDGWTISGLLEQVPWARRARSLIVRAMSTGGEALVEIPLRAAGVRVTCGTNLAGEPRDRVEFAEVAVAPEALVGGNAEVDAACAAAAALHSAALVGAIDAAGSCAREHAAVREQFGKPLAAFQAVAHGIARMAAGLALADAAARTCLAGDPDGWRSVAARIVTAQAATDVARTAHQVLGAMGVTREHPLHLATRRLWAWRDDGIAQRTLQRRLGEAALASGADVTWDWWVGERDRLAPGIRSAWRDDGSWLTS